MGSVLRGKFEGRPLYSTYDSVNNKDGITFIRINDNKDASSYYPLIPKTVKYYKVVGSETSQKDIFLDNHFYVTLMIKYIDGETSTIKCEQKSNFFNGIEKHCVSYEEYKLLNKDEREKLVNSSKYNSTNILKQKDDANNKYNKEVKNVGLTFAFIFLIPIIILIMILLNI